MNFYGLKDFYVNKIVYRAIYLAGNNKQREYYKRQVYSISFENEYVKDVIWEYLNDDENCDETITRVYMQRVSRGKK